MKKKISVQNHSTLNEFKERKKMEKRKLIIKMDEKKIIQILIDSNM